MSEEGLAGLRDAVVEAERHVAGFGWDQPPRLFALVRTQELLAREPALGAQFLGLDEDAGPSKASKTSTIGPSHLTAVEQDGLAPTSSIESMLATMAWPAEVDGAAIALERVVVPPEAERDLPEDPEQAVEHLAAHAERRDVRLVVGVLRDGTAMCALRQRLHDQDTSVAVGPNLVPGLVHALLATLAD
ncbi:MAG: PPA1309 family protein [Actinomycetota bacterium]|nr:PPA1309 family protein [Actinomycetota bacterium]